MITKSSGRVRLWAWPPEPRDAVLHHSVTLLPLIYMLLNNFNLYPKLSMMAQMTTWLWSICKVLNWYCPAALLFIFWGKEFTDLHTWPIAKTVVSKNTFLNRHLAFLLIIIFLQLVLAQFNVCPTRNVASVKECTIQTCWYLPKSILQVDCNSLVKLIPIPTHKFQNFEMTYT